MHALWICLLVCEQASVSSSSGKTTSTSSVDDLDLPSPPSNLSLNQQQEYMQLKRKLALHEKKKLKDPNYGSAKFSFPGIKITGSTKGVTSKPLLLDTGCSPTSPPLSTSEETDSALFSKTTEEVAEEESFLVLECRKKLADTAKKLKDSRAQEEEEQQKITALTNQLTECVSEIVEHEQVMVRVQQQLALLRREQEVCACSVGVKVHVQWNL